MGYSRVPLGNASLANMQMIPDQMLESTTMPYSRFAQSASGPFELLSPDQAIGAVPYALNGSLAAGNSGFGPMYPILRFPINPVGPASVVNMAGGCLRAVDGPTNPSSTACCLLGHCGECLPMWETTGLIGVLRGTRLCYPRLSAPSARTLIRTGRCSFDRTDELERPL